MIKCVLPLGILLLIFLHSSMADEENICWVCKGEITTWACRSKTSECKDVCDGNVDNIKSEDQCLSSCGVTGLLVAAGAVHCLYHTCVEVWIPGGVEPLCTI